MKHISLFEYYSDMPNQFSVQEIKNMTKDQFLMNLKNLAGAKDDEQAFTMMQIWTRANPNAILDRDFVEKLGRIFPEGTAEDLFRNKVGQLDYYKRTKKHPELLNQIENQKGEIKNYEEMLRMAKDTLARLESEARSQAF